LLPDKIDSKLQPISPNYIGAYMGADIQLYNLLEWVLKQTGKARVTVVTFSMNEEFIRKILQLKNAQLIDNITIILDSKAISKTQKIAAFAKNVFTEMYFAKTHAKVILIKNENHNIAIVGSQNFTRGNREESGIITNVTSTVQIYDTEIKRIKSSAVQFENQKIEAITPIRQTAEKRKNFSFSKLNNYRRTQGVEYFALFQNIKMNLEYLKSEPENVDMFVMPMIKFITENNVKQILPGPKGSRTLKNGFHFATLLLEKTQRYVDFQIIDAFENRNNHIYLKENIAFDTDAYLFDDICTRGTTIRKMVEYTNLKNKLIVICNH